MTTHNKAIKATKYLLPLAGILALAIAFGGFTAPGSKAQDEKTIIGNIDETALHGIIRDYLVNNPEVVVEALESYQAKQQEAEQAGFSEKLAANRAALEQGPFAGNPDGDIVIVEFFDYNCGYCKRALPDVEKILENHKDVKIVFKELPILSSSSSDAARWALAADKQGKYWEYHRALMSHSGSKSVDNLAKIAKDIGLDVDRMKKDADSKDVRAAIEESTRLSRELGIRGTPAFIIGDVFAPGYMGYDNMHEVIEDVRKDQG